MKLSDYFYYDPSSPSCLRNKVSRRSARQDMPQGTLGNRGYWQIRLLGERLVQHRIIWELHFGPIPEGKVIDHIDRDKSNNRIENLRCTSQSSNMTNQPQRNNSGHKGVYQNQTNGKYQVRSLKDRKYLKTVQTIEEQLELQDKDLQERFGLSRQDLFCC